MNSVKITVIANWEFFNCVKDVQSFLSFANFYWHFIKEFSQLVSSLTTLICKNINCSTLETISFDKIFTERELSLLLKSVICVWKW